MKKGPFVSIIIPFGEKSGFIEECLRNCLKQSYKNFELIVLPDKKISLGALGKKARVVPTGKLGPAEKRDIALDYAKGDICAFIDDDAYPAKDWIKNAIPFFENTEIAAVAGPGLTPKEDSFFQRLGGAFYESVFGSGSISYRVNLERERFVDDIPAYNLFVRKKVLLEVGGYDSTFYGGEDTKLCLKIVDAGYKIFYSPKIVVYHHRRAFPLAHFKQLWSVGKHRGFFVKAFPKTSRRLLYFLPSIGTICFLALITAALFSTQASVILLALLVVCFLAVFVSGLQSGFFIALLLPLVVLSTHVCYGVGFIKGLLLKNLER